MIFSTQAFHTHFFWIFLAFYFLHEGTELFLEILNFCHVKKQTQVPDHYQSIVSPATFEKSKKYTLEKLKFTITARLSQIPFFWILIFRNGFNTMDYYAAHFAGLGTLSHSVLFCVFITLYFGIIALPYKLYSTFVIEEKYGFNKMTFGIFVADLIKSLFLASIVGLPLLYLIFKFMNFSNQFWWLWVWGALTAFQIFIVAVYPTFLAPLFNKFKPLSDSNLHDRITELAKKINFKMSGVFVMDGSKRSGHSNAYFSGMGAFRRIVLFDTLIKKLTPDELVAVLAHEMGHNVKKHIRNSTILSSILSLIGFYILSLLINWPEFYQAFNVTAPSHHTALVIFALASEVFTFMLTPLMNFISRKNEYEADRFSVEMTGNKEAMKESLYKLALDNLSNFTPHPSYSFFHYSHPTTIERAKAIDEL